MSDPYVDPPAGEIPGSFTKPSTWKKRSAVKKKAKKKGKGNRCGSKIGSRGSELQCTLGSPHDGRHTNKEHRDGWTTLWFWDHGGKHIQKYRYEDQKELELDWPEEGTGE